MTTLLLVPGSLRRDSLNVRLLHDLAARVASRCTVDLLAPAQIGLPLFDQDLEQDAGVVDRVAALHRRFKGCDGLIVASPEYNGQLPACLKNLVDWVSRLAHIDGRFDNPFLDRPVLLCSASTGWSGGAVAIPHARALFGHVGAAVIGDTVCIPHADQAWTGTDYAFDPFFDEQIDGAATRIVLLAKAFAITHP